MKLFILLIILLFILVDLIMVMYALSLFCKFEKSNLEFNKLMSDLIDRMSKINTKIIKYFKKENEDV